MSSGPMSMFGPYRLPSPVLASCAGFLLLLLSACAPQEAGPLEHIEVTRLEQVAEAFPLAAPLIAQARPDGIERTDDGYRVVARPMVPELNSRWRTSARTLVATVPDGDAGSFELSVPSRGYRVGVRRIGAEGANAVAIDNALHVRGGDAAIDGFMFAATLGVEELLLVREPAEPIAYELDLPPKWTLRRAKGHRPIVEMLDGAGVPRMRMVADRAWDEAGTQVKLAMIVAGRHVSVVAPVDAGGAVLVDPLWQGTGVTSEARTQPTATLLSTGMVLVAGGGYTGVGASATAELFDPRTAVFEPTGSMAFPRHSHTATLLGDGSVLVAGGLNVLGWEDPNVPNILGVHDGVKAAERYDTVTGSFVEAGELRHARGAHTATRLHDGTVLIAGGLRTQLGAANAVAAASYAELYRPDFSTAVPAGDFEEVDGLIERRARHQAVLLTNGDVLIVGGRNSDGALATTERYIASEKRFVESGVMSVERSTATALLLPQEQQVLVVGGLDAPGQGAHAELLSIGSGGTSLIAESPNGARSAASGSLLPDGLALIAGGAPPDGVWHTTADLYDPSSKSLVDGGSMPNACTEHPATLTPQGKVAVFADTYTALYDPEEASLMEPAPAPIDGGRWRHTATLLPSGKVLVIGGDPGDGSLPPNAQTYDPVEKQFNSLNGQPNEHRHGHTATRLPDGRVLIVGGRDPSAYPWHRSAELFEPGPQTFTGVGDMSQKRGWHTATLLPDGRVLVAGGIDAFNGQPSHRSAELFNPNRGEHGEFVPTGDMVEPRHFHAASLLPNGKVLIVGGAPTEDYHADGYHKSAEVFDPTANGGEGEFSLLDDGMDMPILMTSTEVLPDGRVLVAGSGMAIVALFDPTVGEGTFGHALGLTTTGQGLQTVLLPSGNVLLAGGWGYGSTDGTNAPTRALEIFDSTTNSFRPAGLMSEGRANFASALLADGSVLLVGGHIASGVVTDTVDLWREASPGIESWRPVVDSAPDNVQPGKKVTITGTGFSGVTEASGGHSPSPTNHPVAMWMPIEGAPSHGRMLEWTDTKLTWRVPATSYAGPGLLFIIVNGIRSVGVSMTIKQAPSGVACPGDGACESGYCTDGVCCDVRCHEPCMACSAARQGGGTNGECGPVPADAPVREDPDGACNPQPKSTCATTGYCDGFGECQRITEGCYPNLCATEGEARCLDPCSSNLDCVDGTICNADGECVKEQEVEDGCAVACAIGSRRTGGFWAVASLLGLAGAAGLRRRRWPAGRAPRWAPAGLRGLRVAAGLRRRRLPCPAARRLGSTCRQIARTERRA